MHGKPLNNLNEDVDLAQELVPWREYKVGRKTFRFAFDYIFKNFFLKILKTGRDLANKPHFFSGFTIPVDILNHKCDSVLDKGGSLKEGVFSLVHQIRKKIQSCPSRSKENNKRITSHCFLVHSLHLLTNKNLTKGNQIPSSTEKWRLISRSKWCMMTNMTCTACDSI